MTRSRWSPNMKSVWDTNDYYHYGHQIKCSINPEAVLGQHLYSAFLVIVTPLSHPWCPPGSSAWSPSLHPLHAPTWQILHRYCLQLHCYADVNFTSPPRPSLLPHVKHITQTAFLHLRHVTRPSTTWLPLTCLTSSISTAPSPGLRSVDFNLLQLLKTKHQNWGDGVFTAVASSPELFPKPHQKSHRIVDNLRVPH